VVGGRGAAGFGGTEESKVRRDYYSILGLGRNATSDEIRKTFYKLAHRWHPDKNPGDLHAEDRFKEINEAYTCLSDPTKRVKYDLFGIEASGFRFRRADLDSMPIRGLIIKKLGRMAGLRFSEEEHRDVRVVLHATLEEAATGAFIKTIYRRQIRCRRCGGTGEKSRVPPAPCKKCGGSGSLPIMFPIEGIEKICTKCSGSGCTIKSPCKLCKGTGVVMTIEEKDVSLPRGARNGSEIRMRDAGHFSRFHGVGDLIAIVELKKHPFFQRHGLDLSCEIIVSSKEAGRGLVVEVPGMGSVFKLKISPNTRHGAVYRLWGRGLQDHDGSSGHLYVKVLHGD